MKKRISSMLNILSTLTLVTAFTLNAVGAAAPKITKEELRPMLDNPDVVVLDVRTGRDWKASEYKIKGAVRADHSEVESVASKYDKDKTLVIYCA